MGGLRPAPCAQHPRPAPLPTPRAAHLAAAGAAGHVGAGHDVQLRGAVRGVGADTVLTLGVHWRAGLGAPGGAREAGAPAAPQPARPSPAPVSAPTPHPAHLVFGIFMNTHALGHLRERNGSGSAAQPGTARALRPLTRSIIRGPSGELLHPSTAPQPPHATAPPHPRPQTALGLDLLSRTLATYHTSGRGSTSRAASRSSRRTPGDTQGASPCRGWHCTLERQGRSRGRRGSRPPRRPCGTLAPPPTLGWTPPPKAPAAPAAAWLRKEVRTCPEELAQRPRGPTRLPAPGGGVLQKVTLQQVSVRSTPVTRCVPSSVHSAGGLWLHFLGWQTMPLPPSRQTQSLQSNSKCSPNCRTDRVERGEALSTPYVRGCTAVHLWPAGRRPCGEARALPPLGTPRGPGRRGGPGP